MEPYKTTWNVFKLWMPVFYDINLIEIVEKNVSWKLKFKC